MKTFAVAPLYYYAGRFGVIVNGERYEYAVSPYIAEKFRILLQYNKGRALALLRGLEV